MSLHKRLEVRELTRPRKVVHHLPILKHEYCRVRFDPVFVAQIYEKDSETCLWDTRTSLNTSVHDAIYSPHLDLWYLFLRFYD